MHKRILTIVVLLCAVPVLALAWQLNTWVKTPGGQVTITKGAGGSQPANPLVYDSTDGSKFSNFTTSVAPVVTFQNGTGYAVSALTVNGAPSAALSAPTLTAGQDNSVWVEFLRTQLTFNVTATGAGIVSPSGLQANVYADSSIVSRVFSFIPAKGSSVTQIVATNCNYSVTYIDLNGNKQIIGPVASGTTNLTAMLNKKAYVTVSKFTGGNATLTGSFSGSATTSFGAFSTAKNNTAYKVGAACDACHINQGVDYGRVILTNWSSSGHRAQKVVCASCHVGASSGAHPGTLQCSTCHNGIASTTFKNFSSQTAVSYTDIKGSFTACTKCHRAAGFDDTKTAGYNHDTEHTATDDCLQCHSIGIKHPGTLVNDNSGVRAIKPEFARNSHHIYNGATVPTAAQCIVCHAEGQVIGGVAVLNTNIHMNSNKIYLRNGNTGLVGNQSQAQVYKGVSVYVWDPQSPNHTAMDQFCMSCHNANGAVTAYAAVGAAVPASPVAAAAKTPFGTSVTNGYDQMARSAVVNVFSQFSTSSTPGVGNASHHAVRGKRYSGRTRTAADPRKIGVTDAVFAQNSSNVATASWSTQADVAQYTMRGIRTTLFDGNLNSYAPGVNTFVSTFLTLSPASGVDNTLGDDSLLHCGDCHTVGQWKAGSTVNAAGVATTSVIGAHGSANEYMLRNTKGSDELHTGGPNNGNDIAVGTDVSAYAMLVCYNCHKFSRYGALAKHQGVNSGGDCDTDKWTFGSTGQIGTARLLRTGNSSAWGNGGGGNMFGIQCANCHNGGYASPFGGIHGSNISYTDGTGTTQRPYRFLPGLGNVKYAPNNHLPNSGAQAIAHLTNNVNTLELTTTWEEKTIYTGSRATCYTINTAVTAPAYGVTNNSGQYVLGTWGACTDHGGTTNAGGHGGPRDLQRPLTY
jgi:hypothetical protein